MFCLIIRFRVSVSRPRGGIPIFARFFFLKPSEEEEEEEEKVKLKLKEKMNPSRKGKPKKKTSFDRPWPTYLKRCETDAISDHYHLVLDIRCTACDAMM